MKTKTLFHVEERQFEKIYLENTLIKSTPYLTFNEAIRALKYYEKSNYNNIVEIVKHVSIDEPVYIDECEEEFRFIS